MTKSTKTTVLAIAAAALDPWVSLKSETLDVPEWGHPVTLRGMTAGDWLSYNALARELTPGEPLPDGAPPAQPLEAARSNLALYALVLIRCLHDKDRGRVFAPDASPLDEDERATIAQLAGAFGPVHDRLVNRAYELSGLGREAPDPVADAGNV